MKSEFKHLIKKYHQLNITQTKQEFDEIKQEFVCYSNQLEGSNLTLIQTKEIISHHKIKGEASVIDTLMAIDHYKSLNQALYFGANQYALTEKLLLNIHKILFKNTFEVDPFYLSWKNKGQQLGQYKVTSNRIKYTINNQTKYYETPTPEESKKLIVGALENYQNSQQEFIIKLSKLVQNIYNAHPFFDGNKRITRLLIANQLISNKLPLIPIPYNKGKYNKALIEGFINQTHLPIQQEIETIFNQFLVERIEEITQKTKKPNKGFGLII